VECAAAKVSRDGTATMAFKNGERVWWRVCDSCVVSVWPYCPSPSRTSQHQARARSRRIHGHTRVRATLHCTALSAHYTHTCPFPPSPSPSPSPFPPPLLHPDSPRATFEADCVYKLHGRGQRVRGRLAAAPTRHPARDTPPWPPTAVSVL
jgi:hypothetical protein